MPTAHSRKYPALWVPSAGVRFSAGVAEVTEYQAAQLRRLPEDTGVTVDGLAELADTEQEADDQADQARDELIAELVDAAEAAPRAFTPAKVREWARKNGVKCPSKGRVPQPVADAYLADRP